jgi:hypothetical protein
MTRLPNKRDATDEALWSWSKAWVLGGSAGPESGTASHRLRLLDEPGEGLRRLCR